MVEAWPRNCRKDPYLVTLIAACPKSKSDAIFFFFFFAIYEYLLKKIFNVSIIYLIT